MSLLDTFLPQHQFSEMHRIRIAAPPGRVLDLVPRLDVADFPLAKLFLHLRALPARVAAFAGAETGARRVDATFGLHDFTVLGRDGDRECAFGLVGRFWEPTGGLIRVAADDFHGFSEPGVAKLVMTFVAEPCDGAGTLLTTRTCVHCPDQATRRRFAPYWYLIRVPSGWIRRMLLLRIRQLAEARA
ncbi:hypothetical protein ACKZDW_19710 [Ralstonia syzygii subsp. celebesensis]|uniref:DUF2867 domain-containing protein n=3 Tax=Ralstonia solanacearum species complex TaxID=3116862 RepID=A0AAD0S8R0_RALSL|nr:MULTISPECIES: hypothetical protein [Ralstonia solanacearum species complex]CCA80066.1 conserved hypothetical protein [blood disease bacterium R229]AQW29662.1 hypothetical protein B0B51_06440 [blood disease bacterium A2-HR MARDI]AXV82530.1 hypothetical protein CJO77_13950 [Ralstonia solanacearum]AXW53652.1 hypothetical protein CJO92_13945 [Ralstonia solanacearum]QQV56474.1 hypothetical protein JK151_05700 [Ralstonia syzygii subsp. celebesensis]